jgi:D-alanine-D-alanine ligase
MKDVRAWAVRIFTALGCTGLSRVDFFVTRDTNEIVFNEINTLPGFTPISMYPKMWAAEGLAFPELIDKLIGLAMEG